MLLLRCVPLMLLSPLLWSVLLPPSTALIVPTALGVIGSLGVLGAIGLIVKKKYKKYYRNNNNNEHGNNDGKYGYVQGYFVKGHHGGYGQDSGYDGGYGGGYGQDSGYDGGYGGGYGEGGSHHGGGGGSHYGGSSHHGGGSHYGGGGSNYGGGVSYGGGGSHYGGGGSHHGGGGSHYGGGGSHHGGGGSHYGGGGSHNGGGGHGNHHHGDGILGGGHHHGGHHGGGFLPSPLSPGFGHGIITPDGNDQNGLFPSPTRGIVGGIRPDGSTVGGFASPFIDASSIASRQQLTASSNSGSGVESSAFAFTDPGLLGTSSTAFSALTSGAVETVPSLVLRPTPRELESNSFSSFSPRSTRHIRKRRSLKNSGKISRSSSKRKSLQPWRWSTLWDPRSPLVETPTQAASLDDQYEFQGSKTQVVDNHNHGNDDISNDNKIGGDDNDDDDDDDDEDDSQLTERLEAFDQEGCLSLLRCELQKVAMLWRTPVERLVLELLSSSVIDDTASKKSASHEDNNYFMANSKSPFDIGYEDAATEDSASTSVTRPPSELDEELVLLDEKSSGSFGYQARQTSSEQDCRERFKACPWRAEEMLQLIVFMTGVN